MLVVGLTGGIASGKSTVSRILYEKYKIPIIDADQLARDIVKPGLPAYTKIVQVFGKDVLISGTSNTLSPLDRKKLGNIIFSDPIKRKQLEQITHSYIKYEMFKLLIWYWISGKRIVILDIPLLIETGLWRFVGIVMIIYVSEMVQFHRLIDRDSPNSKGDEKEKACQDAQKRIQSQMDMKRKVAYADIVIDNSGLLIDLENQVDTIVHGWYKCNRLLWILEWLIPPFGLLMAIYAIWKQKRKAKKRGLIPSKTQKAD